MELPRFNKEKKYLHECIFVFILLFFLLFHHLSNRFLPENITPILNILTFNFV
jgi:hypothetical protein